MSNLSYSLSTQINFPQTLPVKPNLPPTFLHKNSVQSSSPLLDVMTRAGSSIIPQKEANYEVSSEAHGSYTGANMGTNTGSNNPLYPESITQAIYTPPLQLSQEVNEEMSEPGQELSIVYPETVSPKYFPSHTKHSQSDFMTTMDIITDVISSPKK